MNLLISRFENLKTFLKIQLSTIRIILRKLRITGNICFYLVHRCYFHTRLFTRLTDTIPLCPVDTTDILTPVDLQPNSAVVNVIICKIFTNTVAMVTGNTTLNCEALISKNVFSQSSSFVLCYMFQVRPTRLKISFDYFNGQHDVINSES